MNNLVWLGVLVLVAGCGGKAKEPDNVVTKYAEDLRVDAQKANAVADEANERIRQQEEEFKKIADQ